MSEQSLVVPGRDENAAEALSQLITQGDLRSLNPEQLTAHYLAVCSHLGLDPSTQPFEYLVFKGKKVLYARRAAAEQLRKRDNISLEIVEQGPIGDSLYRVTVTARLPGGKGKAAREDTDVGVVPIKGLNAEETANAIKKAITQAKRRVTLSICGLGMLDETEVSPDFVVDNQGGEPKRPLPPATPPLLPPPLATTKPSAEPARSERSDHEQRLERGRQADQIDRLARSLGLQQQALCDRINQLYGTSDAFELTDDQVADLIAKLTKAAADKGVTA